MQKIILLLKGLERKTLLKLIAFPMLFEALVQLNTPHKLENGYQFLLSFLSILILLICFIILMLSQIVQAAIKKDHPFYFFKYISFLFLLILLASPFLYLWSMWDTIQYLKW